MGIFDSPADSPFQIKTEGETITINFLNGLPVTGQGTVRWNIPAPAHGCQTTDGRGAYCGMVILLSTTPLQPSNAPIDGTFYEADATADFDMHVGDKINGALVVGAFYEGEERSRGEDLATSFIISDVKKNTPYYVAGYAVDCQGRYHREGVRAYSDEFSRPIDPSTPSTQTVILGDGNGVIPTDGTGLIAGQTYKFELMLDPTFPIGSERRTILFSADGINISTYGDLVNEINKAIALADNPPQSPVAPNTGRYYWNSSTKSLYQWDGSQHIPVDVRVEPTDPAQPLSGDYWYNTSTESLYRWDIPTTGTWNSVPIISYNEDPRSLSGGNDFWFDGTNVYGWCGTTWCQLTLHNTPDNPSVIVLPTDCGEYWYDETNLTLNEWSLEEQRWVERYAIMWDVAPNNLTLGTYWFDDSVNKLFIASGSPQSWIEIPLLDEVPVGSPIAPRLVIAEDQPTAPITDLHWYKTSTEQLFVWDGVQFNEAPVIVWPLDPTDTNSCDLWWNAIDDNLYKWDVVHSEWDLVSSFTKSLLDPHTQPTFAVGEMWYNPTTQILKRWNGVDWVVVNFVNFPSDPTLPADGTAWFNPGTNEWAIWGTPVASQWNVVDPIDSPVNPFLIPSGTLWFDTSINALYERMGSPWIAIPFSTTSFTPTKGQVWFDSTNNILMEWNGSEWIPAVTLATAKLDENGFLKITSSYTGSMASVMILVPADSLSGVPREGLATGNAGHEYLNYAYYEDVLPPITSVSAADFLFDFLSPDAFIRRQVYGTDGIEPLPSYEQVGVGDDGSPDERRELADSIRSQLGYPTVEVELTPYQINTAIDLAIETLRLKSSAAYKRGFFFLDVQPGYQKYKLTNKTVGFHKVVTVMSAHRFTSAFLSSAHGSGVYGQVVLQHLYNMGTFDLLSYHLVSQYVEQLEHLFATRLTFNWNESDRTLSFYHSFTVRERVLLDAMLERTEQEILKDRWTKTWVERFALAESMRMLAQVRGKFASLPGAGGGIALNASDLMAQHDAIKQELFEQIDDFVVNSIEDVGMQSTFIIG